jgi:LPS sulfotransferase NodH
MRRSSPKLAAKLKREIRRVGKQFKPAKLRLEYGRLVHQFHLHRHWWLRAHEPYQPVFVIASARSGSNLLVDCLNQLPGVVSHSEILNFALTIGPRRPLKPRKALQHIRRSLQALPTPYRGCKLFLNQLRKNGLAISSLMDAFPDSKFIILYRQSLAEQYASLQLARSTRQWVLFQGESQKRALVKIDPAALRRYCDEMRSGYQRALATPSLAERSVLLSYEELTADPARCFSQQICPLLQLPPHVPRTGLSKQNPEPLALRIANYTEVAALLNSPLCRQYHAWPGQRILRRAA